MEDFGVALGLIAFFAAFIYGGASVLLIRSVLIYVFVRGEFTGSLGPPRVGVFA